MKAKKKAAAKINAQLKSLVVGIDRLHGDPQNAKTHPPKNLARIKRSLRRYGQQKPIVVVACTCTKIKGPHAYVVAGNGTWQMAKLLGWPEIARVEYDNEKTARQYGLMDNRSSEGGKYDDEMVDDIISEAEELELDPADVGFEDEKIEIEDDVDTEVEGLTYSVIVDFVSEEDQSKLLAELEGRGLACRLLIS